MKYPWLDVAKKIQAIAQAGLTYSDNKYDVERYTDLSAIASQIMADFTGTDLNLLPGLFMNETGYQTPKVDVRGVVFRGNKILMIRETIDNCWALPGGWADIGISAKETVVKEVAEEAGLQVDATKLLAVFDKKFHPHPPSPYHVYKMFFLCKETGGELAIGMETSDVGFFSLEALPELSVERNTRSQIEFMFDFLNNPDKATLFD